MVVLIMPSRTAPAVRLFRACYLRSILPRIPTCLLTFQGALRLLNHCAHFQSLSSGYHFPQPAGRYTPKARLNPDWLGLINRLPVFWTKPAVLILSGRWQWGGHCLLERAI